MRVQIVTPFLMQWVTGFKKHFEHLGWDVDVHNKPRLAPKPDVQLLMWLNDDTVSYVNSGYSNGTKKIVFIRRYEYFTDAIEQTNWKNVDAVVMVNDYLAQGFEQRTGIKPYLIPNGVDPEMWRYKPRVHGKQIALVGFVNERKNIPMALQILSKLPQEYELHIAGGFQDGATVGYISNFAAENNLTHRVFMYGQVNDIDLWLEDKNYLLCTAISEGCPNNVIEAMAKGIKPIVHNWPGSRHLFRGYVFDTIDEALGMMHPESAYASWAYRNMAEVLFGGNIYNNVAQLILETADEKQKTFHDLDWNVTIRPSKPDVFIVSYPKCGRTWLRLFYQMAISRVMNEDFVIEANRIYPRKSEHPSIEFTHSHINWDHNIKTVFLTRDIKDVLVSSYFHCQRRAKSIPMDMSISEFIRSPKGGAEFIIEWHKLWEKRLHDTDCMRLSYERFHNDPNNTFMDFLIFTGMGNLNPINQREVDICIKAAQFDEVKKNVRSGRLKMLLNSETELNRYRRFDESDPESAKLRKGKIGGYEDYLSEEDIEYINNKIMGASGPGSSYHVAERPRPSV